MICNHIKQSIKREYAWLSVNQEFSDAGLLERAITKARGDHQEARNTKFLITRHDAVARGMMAEVPYHYVDKLEQEDA